MLTKDSKAIQKVSIHKWRRWCINTGRKVWRHLLMAHFKLRIKYFLNILISLIRLISNFLDFHRELRKIKRAFSLFIRSWRWKYTNHIYSYWSSIIRKITARQMIFNLNCLLLFKITLKVYNSEDVINFNLDEIKYKIFAKSYLGFGLNSARLGIFKSDTLCLLKSKLSLLKSTFDVTLTYI